MCFNYRGTAQSHMESLSHGAGKETLTDCPTLYPGRCRFSPGHGTGEQLFTFARLLYGI